MSPPLSPSFIPPFFFFASEVAEAKEDYFAPREVKGITWTAIHVSLSSAESERDSESECQDVGRFNARESREGKEGERGRERETT